MLKNNYINFNKALKPVLIIYAAVIVVGIVLSVIFGINLDINFSGGTRIAYSYSGTVDTNAVAATATEALGQEATVSLSSGMNDSLQQMIITLPGNTAISTELQDNLTTALQTNYTGNSFVLSESNSVSPTIAGTFFAKSIAALIIAGALVVIYVGIRFRNIGGVSAGLMAFAALFLDCVVAFLACVAFKLPVDSNLIAVILTLLGYSLNDTIVIYDRVRENKRLYPAKQLDELVDESINTVKTRNFITTLTTTLAVITIIVVSEIYGLTTLRSFAIPMAFGIVSGCISSLFVSGPLWVKWKNFADKRKAAKGKK